MNQTLISLPLLWRVYIGLALLTAFMTALAHGLALTSLPAAESAFFLIILGLGISAIIAKWAVYAFKHSLDSVENALMNMQDQEYGTGLSKPPQPELSKIITLFNKMRETVREQRENLYQKELLLDSVIQTAPMGILLVGPHQRILLANPSIRRQLGHRSTIREMHIKQLLDAAPKALADALLAVDDTLLTLSHHGEAFSYHLSQQTFDINGQTHRLVLLKEMTREMRRQEVDTWKKLIRLINHELNNLVGPILSMVHTAKHILPLPQQHQKLEPILENIQKTVGRMGRFLEDYATFARLPKPKMQPINWTDFLETVKNLYPFEVENNLSSREANFDPAQMQQVFINLVKNAIEASPEGQPVLVKLSNPPRGGTLIEVLDRGKGMGAEAMEKALLPFFSTKKSGTGLGLPLCREIIESHGGSIALQKRNGPGLKISCWVPA